MTAAPPFATLSRRGALGRLTAVALLAASGLGPAVAGDAAGAAGFESSTQLGGQRLLLNGVGLRAVAWIKGYAAGLYLGQRSSSSEQVLGQPGPKRLRLRMLLDVPVDEFVKAFHKGVARNVPAEQQPQLAERMQRFDSLLRPLGEVHKGDQIDLDFVPGRGLVFVYNGQPQGTAIPGEDLYGALLACFLGEHPVDARLKAGLLGQAG